MLYSFLVFILFNKTLKDIPKQIFPMHCFLYKKNFLMTSLLNFIYFNYEENIIPKIISIGKNSIFIPKTQKKTLVTLIFHGYF